MRLSNKILLATGNLYKFEEFKAICRDYPELEIIRARDIVRNDEKLNFVEIHHTYLENAIAKARVTQQTGHYPTLGDDSGIEVISLEGRPGVRSHRYATPKAGWSQDEANRALLLQELKSHTDRSAQMVCSLALVIEGILIHATGVLKGKILEAPRGVAGFGYDSLFQPDGMTHTLAELSLDEKCKISHRGLAFRQLMMQVQERGIVFAKP